MEERLTSKRKRRVSLMVKWPLLWWHVGPWQGDYGWVRGLAFGFLLVPAPELTGEGEIILAAVRFEVGFTRPDTHYHPGPWRLRCSLACDADEIATRRVNGVPA